MNAGICMLCSADVLSVRSAIDRYKDIDINFDGSREGKFLEVSIAPCVKRGGQGGIPISEG